MPAAARKPRKLVLSPTRIRAWLECQLQYKFTYLDRLSRFYYKPNRFDTFGAVMHRTLQMFHEAGGPAAVPADQLAATLDSCWTSAGYSSQDEEQAQLQLGREVVEQYWAISAENPAATLLVEKQLRHSYDIYTLMGRLDRLDEHQDGTLEIVDYKSGLLEISPEEVHASLAMICYTLLVGKAYPDRPVIATIIGLAGGCSASTQFTQDELDVFEEDAHRVAEQVMDREQYAPTYGGHCASCIYTQICYGGGPIDWEAKRAAAEAADDGVW